MKVAHLIATLKSGQTRTFCLSPDGDVWDDAAIENFMGKFSKLDWFVAKDPRNGDVFFLRCDEVSFMVGSIIEAVL